MLSVLLDALVLLAVYYFYDVWIPDVINYDYLRFAVHEVFGICKYDMTENGNPITADPSARVWGDMQIKYAFEGDEDPYTQPYMPGVGFPLTEFVPNRDVVEVGSGAKLFW